MTPAHGRAVAAGCQNHAVKAIEPARSIRGSRMHDWFDEHPAQHPAQLDLARLPAANEGASVERELGTSWPVSLLPGP